MMVWHLGLDRDTVPTALTVLGGLWRLIELHSASLDSPLEVFRYYARAHIMKDGQVRGSRAHPGL